MPRGTTIDATDGPRDRFQSTKDIVAFHFPGGNCPPGLMTDIFKALGEAEHRGFAECLSIFQRQSSADNDNRAAE